MRKILILTLVLATVVVGCTSKKEEYKSADGAVTAVHRGERWTITGADGREVVEGYDSMRVAEVGEDGHPMTILYYKGDVQTVIQYYATMELRCRGELKDGKREGLWQYWYENGNLQAEATYVGGREDGDYRVWREDGTPYYLGRYSNGARTGVWEVYDKDGNLVERREY